jgi:hypothetical protein
MILGRSFWKPDKFYLLKVWLIATFFIALVCAYDSDIRTYPISILPKNFLYSVGVFAGVTVFELEYSLVLFICLYLLFYLFTRMFFLSELFVKILLFMFFLLGAFIANHIFYPWTWFHQFFYFYSTGGALGFCIFDVYKFVMEDDDLGDDNLEYND